MKKTAVVLLNLGGPDSLDAVQPFLENLFNDPDIFKLPFQKSLARYISKKRAPKVVKHYETIGGKSPINKWTELQRQLLEVALRKEYPNTDVFVAMRGKSSGRVTINFYSNDDLTRILELVLGEPFDG